MCAWEGEGHRRELGSRFDQVVCQKDATPSNSFLMQRQADRGREGGRKRFQQRNLRKCARGKTQALVYADLDSVNAR